MAVKREDDFENRRAHLKDLTDEQLQKRFWELATKVVDPMLQLAKTNTTPAIERSVLLRMGFSSLEAKDIVDNTINKGLIGKGCGHIVYKLSKKLNRDYISVGTELARGEHWEQVIELFKGGTN